MGTRADFYVGRGESAEWLGSIAWDGYPDGIPTAVVSAKSEPRFRDSVALMLAERSDATLPRDGWPWPWATSATTDYAYAFDATKVLASCFGGKWYSARSKRINSDESGKTAVFPDMTSRRRVAEAGTKRSGLMVISIPTTR